MSVSPKLRSAVSGLLSLGFIGVVACSEPTAPVGGESSLFEGASASGKYSTRNRIETAAAPGGTTETTQVLPANTVKFQSWATPSTRDTSFTVVVGKASTHQIMYAGTLFPFLKLEIPKSADFFGADGRALIRGSTVSVTVRVDPVYAAVQFGPHGTSFKKYPAKVCLSYWGLDLAGVTPTAMSVWYQPSAETAWTAQSTQLNTEFWWFCANLSHFSNYAIAY